MLKFQPMLCTDIEVSFKILIAIDTSVVVLPARVLIGASPITLSIVLTACNSVVGVICVAII
mgnify:FL=1